MKKINFSNSKVRGALKGKGFYIALAVCIVAVGVAGASAYNQTIDKLREEPLFSAPDLSSEDADPVDKAQQGIPKEPEEPSSFGLSVDDSTVAVIEQAQAKVMPLIGELINPYSNGELVKSETLNVWKTHDGIDIKGELGAHIKAMTGGTVSEVYQDPLWGNCVVIEHVGGVVGYYFNLNNALPVAVGDSVKAGTVIGTIGDSAEIESAMASHLHFGLKQNGEWIDPIEYINPGKS